MLHTLATFVVCLVAFAAFALASAAAAAEAFSCLALIARIASSSRAFYIKYERMKLKYDLAHVFERNVIYLNIRWCCQMAGKTQQKDSSSLLWGSKGFNCPS